MRSAPNIVLIKTSSLGDVLHNLPVVTDIHRHLPQARIDWIVEESFVLLPGLHPAINRVIPVALRRWRKSWWQARSEIQASYRVGAVCGTEARWAFLGVGGKVEGG